jgi:hypothetical protein
MTINTIKDLELLLKVLRKQGVTECSVDGIVLKLGDVPESKKVTDDSPTLPSPQLTDEQLLFWSAGN